MKPEEINDEFSLIRDQTRDNLVKGITTKQLRKIVHDLYLQAGLIKPTDGKPGEFRHHSIKNTSRPK
jgi:hypothetical protein